jgi:hypothetical protein
MWLIIDLTSVINWSGSRFHCFIIQLPSLHWFYKLLIIILNKFFIFNLSLRFNFRFIYIGIRILTILAAAHADTPQGSNEGNDWDSKHGCYNKYTIVLSLNCYSHWAILRWRTPILFDWWVTYIETLLKAKNLLCLHIPAQLRTLSRYYATPISFVML